ncbi:ubiquinol-cytochrome c reductase iron-sulfur subunit-like [Oppia nitens]|uniref:ubiquinol-cytochrome c reductase iron-sulfur subunit-like n=1 Tax=Oppia nitens TaxID=1686743 RepID=UPI0023DB41F3|nr:ubiquinol-cytochrome c reductase iron-sulfur subunit-like [Oppia nitens]
MLSVSARGGVGLSNAVRAVTQAVGGRTIAPTPTHPLLSQWEEREESLPSLIPCDYQDIAIDLATQPLPRPHTSYGLSQTMFKRQLSIGTGIGVGTQLRYYHNDIKIPSFDDVRKDSTRDPSRLAKESRDERRLPLDVVKVGVGVTGLIAAKKIVHTIVANLSPAASTLAMGVIEVDLNKIPEGTNITIKWNNKPVFVRHRTAEEVARERAQDIGELRDPQTDEVRSYAHTSGKWLIVMANCTHLGCVPIANQGNWGGYYCPCHGSHYDASGRIRKGPAPLNLEVPDHHIVEEENKLVLGIKAPA